MHQRSCTRKPRREVQNQLTVVKLNHHNVEISNIRHIEKVFANVRHKLNRAEDDEIVLDQKSECDDLWIICVVGNECSDTSP